MIKPSQQSDIPLVRHQTDVLIIGGGAAATMAAFECADAGVGVIQVTKGRATSGTTTVARGGFAAAMGEDDSPELHLQDILKYGGELIDPELSSERLLYRLFHEHGVRVFRSTSVEAKCSCSRDNVAAMLKSFSPGDRDHMVENGVISVTCEFCSSTYMFRPDEVAG